MPPSAPDYRWSLRSTWAVFLSLGVLLGALSAWADGWHAGRGDDWVAVLGAVAFFALWLLGGLIWQRRRSCDLLTQRRWFSELVEEVMVPSGQCWDPGMITSPWNVEHASLRLNASGSACAASDWCLFNRSQMGLLLLEVDATGEAAALQRALVLHLWRALVQVSVAPGRTLLDVRLRLQTRHGVTTGWRGFYAQADLTTGVLSYAGWGLSGLYILGRGGVLTPLSSRAWGAAGMAPSQRDALEQGQVTLVEGESLLLFTEALLTLENAEGERFGLSRLQKALRERPGCGPAEILAEIQRAVESFVPAEDARVRDVSLAGLRLVAPYGLASRYEPIALNLGDTLAQQGATEGLGPSAEQAAEAVSALVPVEEQAVELEEQPGDIEAPVDEPSPTPRRERAKLRREQGPDRVRIVRAGVLRLPPRRDP